MIKVGLGHDSHRLAPGGDKPLVLGGTQVPADYHLVGNSDADVVVHALVNALSGVTGRPVLGAVSDRLAAAGTLDSRAYLDLARADLRAMGYAVWHVSISVECQKPRLAAHIPAITGRLAGYLGVPHSSVCLTATSGEGLTDCGRGLGIQATCVVTAGPSQKSRKAPG